MFMFISIHYEPFTKSPATYGLVIGRLQNLLNDLRGFTIQDEEEEEIIDTWKDIDESIHLLEKFSVTKSCKID